MSAPRRRPRTFTMPNYQFHVSGMRCPSCVALVESELSGVPGVTQVRADLARHRVEVVADLGPKPEDLAGEFRRLLEKHGYAVCVEMDSSPSHPAPIRTEWSEFRAAVPLALVLIALFIALQYLASCIGFRPARTWAWARPS